MIVVYLLNLCVNWLLFLNLKKLIAFYLLYNKYSLQMWMLADWLLSWQEGTEW